MMSSAPTRDVTAVETVSRDKDIFFFSVQLTTSRVGDIPGSPISVLVMQHRVNSIIMSRRNIRRVICITGGASLL